MNNTEHSFNFGLALLRALMCFEVVLNHFWHTDVTVYLLPFHVLKPYAVPVFMFMSFYLTQKSFVRKDKGYAVNRIWKLVYPLFVWAIVYWIVYWIAGSIAHQPVVKGISDMFWQMFTGHSPQLNATMWFQADLVVITVIFFAIFSLFSEKVGLLMAALLSILCLLLQYSGINWMLFGNMRYELSYPLGRLSEMIPVASMGLAASRFDLLKIKKNSKWFNMGLAAVLIVAFIILDKKTCNTLKDFSYAGVWKIGIAFSITMLASNFGILFTKESKLLKFITSYTLGVYCEHRLVAFFLLNILSSIFGIGTGYFYQCIMIYMLCFAVSFLISKIPIKTVGYIV